MVTPILQGGELMLEGMETVGEAEPGLRTPFLCSQL